MEMEVSESLLTFYCSEQLLRQCVCAIKSESEELRLCRKSPFIAS